MATKKSPAKKSTTSHHGGELHYDKNKVLKGYRQTFSMFMKALIIGVGGAVVYFFGVIIYLGLYGHTHTDNYVQEFGSRIQYDYKGTKLPMYEDPTLANKMQPAAGNPTH